LKDMQGRQLNQWQFADAAAGEFSVPLEWTDQLSGQAAILDIRLSGNSGFIRQAIPVVLW